MTRGDLVTVALQGDHGNPRPALVIQSGQFPETATVTVLLVTSKLVDAPLLRRTVEPSPENGLSKTSQVMIDKAMTVRTDKLGSAFGNLDQAAMLRVNRSLALLLGLAEWCGPGGRLTVLLPAGSTVFDASRAQFAGHGPDFLRRRQDCARRIGIPRQLRRRDRASGRTFGGRHDTPGARARQGVSGARWMRTRSSPSTSKASACRETAT